ncbi:MAG: transposase [Selenomonadaceae bacterium]|nr:transposase [Selenomonadaceae bacterium]
MLTFVLNPLQTNQLRKSLTLRKTKTDKVDAKTIAAILTSNLDLKPYTDANFKMKSLNRLLVIVLIKSNNVQNSSNLLPDL